MVNLYGCEIESITQIEPFVSIQKNAVIDSNCKIASHPFVCKSLTIHSNMFIGHGVVFVEDKFPKSINQEGSLKKNNEWVLEKILIEKRASIVCNATILPGIGLARMPYSGQGRQQQKIFLNQKL